MRRIPVTSQSAGTTTTYQKEPPCSDNTLRTPSLLRRHPSLSDRLRAEILDAWKDGPPFLEEVSLAVIYPLITMRQEEDDA